MLKLWIDDLRPAPEGWIWIKTTNEALCYITKNIDNIEIISIDHDAGYNSFGGDFINVLKELERLSRNKKIIINFPFRLHSMNPVGIQNMREILKHNEWKEVFF